MWRSNSVKANQEDGVFYSSINFSKIQKARVSLFKSLKMILKVVVNKKF